MISFSIHQFSVRLSPPMRDELLYPSFPPPHSTPLRTISGTGHFFNSLKNLYCITEHRIRTLHYSSILKSTFITSFSIRYWTNQRTRIFERHPLHLLFFATKHIFTPFYSPYWLLLLFSCLE